ncbi:lycopene cyclase domain-containing protein [Galactobacter sp.]|uniref:lycopene cyclase domain-containing protein n=1 Tax=Galactobacter sp. TaxID=2676125 RepID=UPI0025BC92E8|nr:lycopene cyclase domain-containing protein [Galactobacter sp.]
MPDSTQYILLMLGCLVLTLPLEFLFKARVYRRPVQLIQAILATVIVFSVWDVVAIGAELWTYSTEFTSGLAVVLGLPLEEVLFFVAIPISALLTYEAVGHVLSFFGALRSTRRAHPGEKEDG